jgi:hypothetical protein
VSPWKYVSSNLNPILKESVYHLTRFSPTSTTAFLKSLTAGKGKRRGNTRNIMPQINSTRI